MKKVLGELTGLAEIDQAPSATGNLLICIVRTAKQ